MKKFNNFIKRHIYIILLFGIGLITHVQWFNPFSILTFSDWMFWPDEVVKQLWNSYGTWNNFFNFGAVNIQLSFYYFKSIWSLFTNLGFSYDCVTKMTFLIPIAVLGFISPYILFKKLIKDKLISFIVALFFGTTTYFLIRQTAHIPVAFVYALTPLIIYFFISALEKNKIFNWIIFVLIFWIGINYEVRIMFIVSLIIISYFLYFHIKEIKKYWKNLLISILLLLLLSLFWLLPITIGGLTKEISSVANRGLFGNFLFDLTHAFALFDSSWTGSYPNMEFIKQPIIWYFWLIPIIAFFSFLLNNNDKQKKKIIYWGIISLIGIFLTKQSAEPLAGTYLYLYNNFPGFNLFREASKFYLVTAIGYMGLLAYTLLLLKENKSRVFSRYLFISFSVIILLISIFNAKPLINSEIGTMFVPKQIARDYLIFKDFVLKDDGFFRTFWTPTYSRWGIYTNVKPKISNVAIVENEWKNYVFSRQGYSDLPNNKKITEIFKIKDANELFDIASIKYVIVPIRDFANDDDFFIYYGGGENQNIREWYISELDNINFLKKINIGTNDLAIYENESFKPHIYITKEQENIYRELSYEKVDFKQKSVTEYEINLRNVNDSFYLNFSEGYHPGWSIKIGDFNWLNAIIKNNYFLSDENHLKNNAGLNSYYFDIKSIKNENYSNINEDGSFNINITLYFKPQSYFYIGLIISGLTLVSIIGYIGYYLKKERSCKRKKLK